VFAATLPLHFAEVGVGAAAPIEMPIGAALMPVIIVDDEAELRHIMEKYLRDSRYQPLARATCVRPGTAAACAATGNRPRHHVEG